MIVQFLSSMMRKLLYPFGLRSFALLLLLLPFQMYSQDLPMDGMQEEYDIEIIEDTLDIDFLDDTIIDEAMIDDEFPWSLSIGILMRNRQIQNGVDLSGNQGIMTLNSDIYNTGGFYAGLDVSRRIGSNPGYQGFNARLGYTYTVNDWLECGMQFTRFGYATDTINPVAAIPNMVSINSTMLFSSTMIDITYDRMFGVNMESVSYLSLTAMTSTSIGELRISPIASIVATRYTIETKRLLLLNTGKTKTISGLSMLSIGMSISYPLSEYFSVNATPMLLFTPQKNLTYNDFQPTVSVGIRYSLDF